MMDEKEIKLRLIETIFPTFKINKTQSEMLDIVKNLYHYISTQPKKTVKSEDDKPARGRPSKQVDMHFDG